MARVHRDLEELQTSYSAFGHENNDGPHEDDENPPGFHQSPHRKHSWVNKAGLPRHSPTSHAKDHGDHDHPPGGIIIHTVTEESKTRWSHIDDLDSFFKNVYSYHQRSGFHVMLVQVLLYIPFH